MENNSSEIISSLFDSAISKYNSGDFEDAIQDFKKITKIDPELSSPYQNIGICKCNLGDLEGAIKEYSKSIQLNKKNEIAYSNRELQNQILEIMKGL